MDRVHFNIKFSQKDEAKKLGAKWDSDEKAWYSDNASVINLLKEEYDVFQSDYVRKYFNVSYSEKKEARDIGAYWDADKKLWYAPNDIICRDLRKSGFEEL